MTEQKRPVLTLKRKTDGEAPARSRKTIINVTTPPKWKVKKQQLADRAVREASLAEKKPGQEKIYPSTCDFSQWRKRSAR